MNKRIFNKLRKQVFDVMPMETYISQIGWNRAHHRMYDKFSRKYLGGVIRRAKTTIPKVAKAD